MDNSSTIDWVLFFDEFASDFHPTFQDQLSQQLYDKGSAGTGITQFHKYDFQLIVGMDDLNRVLVNNRVLARIKFITPTSFSFPVNIYWSCEKSNNLLELHKHDVTNLNVTFDWAENFPLEQILPHIRPYRVSKKENTNLSFDVEYFYYLLPDISLDLYFKDSLTTDEIVSIDTFFSKFHSDWNQKNSGKEIQYISNIKDLGNNIYQVITDIGLANNIKTISSLLKLYAETFTHLDTKKISIR